MKNIIISLVLCVALVGIACAKSPSTSPSKPASFDPVLVGTSGGGAQAPEGGGGGGNDGTMDAVWFYSSTADASASTAALTLPTGIESDMVIVVAERLFNSTSPDPPETIPSGYTSLGSYPTPLDDLRWQFYYKVADGTETEIAYVGGAEADIDSTRRMAYVFGTNGTATAVSAIQDFETANTSNKPADQTVTIQTGGTTPSIAFAVWADETGAVTPTTRTLGPNGPDGEENTSTRYSGFLINNGQLQGDIVAAMNDTGNRNTLISFYIDISGTKNGTFSLADYTSNIACELNANNTSSYSGSGQTWSNLTAEDGCDFYLGDDNTVDATDPDFISGTPSYFDLPNDNNDLEGTERLTSVSKNQDLNNCLLNAVAGSTETTIVAVYNHGDIEHATGAVGFASSGGSTAIMSLGLTTADQGWGVSLYNYEANTVSGSGQQWGGFSQANDDVIGIWSIDNDTSSTVWKMWNNSGYPDIWNDASHTASIITDVTGFGADYEVRLSGNAQSLNGIRGGKFYYFACKNGLIKESEAYALMSALDSEFGGLRPTIAAGDFDVRMGGFRDDTLSVAAEGTVPSDIQFSSTGYHMYSTEARDDVVDVYDCTNPFRVDSCTFNASCVVTAQTSNLQGAIVNEGDSALYVLGQFTDSIFKFNFNPDAPASCSYDTGNTLDISGSENQPRGMCINDAEDYMLLAGAAADTVYEITFSTPGDLTSASITETLDIDGLTSETYNANDISCNDALDQFFIVDSTNDRIRQYNFATPGTLSSVTYNSQSRYTGAVNTQVLGSDFDEGAGVIGYAGNTNDTMHTLIMDQ